MGTVYMRGNNWYIDFYADGRRVRQKVGRSKELAELALKDAEVKAVRKEFGFLREEVSLQRFFREYLEYCKANHRKTTYNRYRAVVEHFQHFLKDHPGLTNLSHINPAVMDRYKIHRKDALVNPNGYPVKGEKDARKCTRRGAKNKTINFELSCLRTAFNLAIKWDYSKDNPARGITKLKVETSVQPRFLSIEECQKFLEACPDALRPIFFTFLNTGLRKAELENLEWADVNLKRKQIHIRAKANWQPKTGERIIPTSDKVHTLLTELKSQNDAGVKSKYVFCDPDGCQLSVKLRNHLIYIARKAGIPSLTKIHTLRHTFASHLVMSGVDLPTVQKLMGHSDIETTMIYAHLAESHMAEAVNKLSISC